MNKRLALDAQTIAQTITSLLLEYPDLADDETLRADMLEGETDLHEFLRCLERDRSEIEVHTEALAIQLKGLKERKHRFERREQYMRMLALKLLNAADLTKVVLPEATYSMRTVPPSVIITDEDALPDAACKFKREPDKTAIKQMLEVGAVDGATMSNGSKTLSIRIG